MIQLEHQNEWLNSNVDIDIIELAVKSLEGTQPYDYLLYSNAISRRNGGRLRDRDLNKYKHVSEGGWWCSGVDPLNEYELMIWGCFKPNKPRRDLSEKKKVIKYEHPYKEPTRAFFLRLSYRVGLAIAIKNGKHLEYQQRVLQAFIANQQTNGFASPISLPSSFEEIPVEWLRTEDKYFWKWVKESNIAVVITEGAKKAGALLSAGYAAIALPGFNSGYRNPKDSYGNSIGNPFLIPEIALYATPGRSITICFDYETKLQTVNNINAAYSQLGRLISIAGAKARIAQLPGPDKGVDDFIVARGVAAFDEIYSQALTLDQWQVRTYNTLSYTPDLIVRQRYLSEIPIPEEEKLVGVLSAKGTGKTFCLIPIVEKAIWDGQPVLILTHRVQLGLALSERFGVSYVTEVKDDETGKLLGYALCVDSLHPNSQARFNADGWKDALVIIDEAEQVIWHTLNADTDVRNHRVEVIRQFSKLMLNVLTSPKGRVILCDADLTDLSFQFILGIAGVDIKPWILVNEWKPQTERICYHYNQTTPAAWFGALVENISNGGRPMILTQAQKPRSQWSTVNIESQLKAKFPELKILRIDSQSILDPTHPAYGCISNNLNEILLEYDVAIASPALETGISIEIQGHFTSVWGCFHGVAPENSARQSLARLREDVDRHLWVAPKGLGTVGNGSINLKSLLGSEHQKLKANLRLLQDASLTLDEDEIHVSHAAINVFGKMACRVNAGMLDYRGTVLRNLKAEGYKIVEASIPHDTDPKECLESLKEWKAQNYLAERVGVASADTSNMTQAQFETLKQQKSKTPAQRAVERKYDLQQRYQVEVTPELVEKDDEGWYPQLRLHYYLSIGKHHLPKRDARKAEAMINQGQLWMPDFNSGQLGTVVAALEILGITELIEKNEPMRGSDRKLQELRDFVLANRAAVKSVLGLYFRADAKPIVILRRLVGKLGLKLKCLGRDGSGVRDSEALPAKRDRIYQIVGQDDGRSLIFSSWKSLDESKSNSMSTSTSANNIVLKPEMDVDETNFQLQVGDDDRDAASWSATIKGYAVRVIECFTSGVNVVLDVLSDLDWQQKWGVMLALDEESPSIFAQFIEAFPNWVEWCNG